MKSGPGLTTSSVFGRQQSWSDQIADSNILKSSSQAYSPTILAPNHHYTPMSNASNSTSSNSDMKFVHSTMEILENQMKRDDAPKKKRTRTTTEQLRILQKAFQTDPMPNSSARVTLSKKLGMSSRAVQVWFQNRRAKDKLDTKRQELGLPSSSFTFVKSGSEDEEDADGNEDDDESSVNVEEEGTSIPGGNNVNSNLPAMNGSTNEKSADFLNSLRASGMISRFAFNSTNSNNPNPNNNSNPNPASSVKSQRSASTPNGFVQGPNNYSHRQPASTASPFINHGFFNSAHHHHQNSLLSHPLCNLFPNETFISDVTEASVDELYQDLGTGSATSPCDDSCVLSDQNGMYNSSNYSRYHNHQTQHNIISGDLASSTSATSGSINNNYFSLGDPFYGGGLIDRTPSVSPIGFGPRAPFYPVNCSYDLLIAPHNNANFTANTSASVLSTSLASAAISDEIVNSSTVSACKSPASGNVFLTTCSNVYNNSNPNVYPTSSYSSSGYYLDTQQQLQPQPQPQQQRRSFSLPEAHGNLTFPQLQQLENFGLQIFPSPLLSINEEDSLNNNNNNNNTTPTTASINNNNHHPGSSSCTQSKGDILVPFNEFLEGEVVR